MEFMPEQILKKEDKLTYLGGIFKQFRGSLVLTTTSIYFLSKKKKVFDIPLKDIISANPQKGLGNGVDFLFILYNEAGIEKRVKIQHFSFMTGASIGTISRLAIYFNSWEQIINDARMGRKTQSDSGLNDLEKLSELKEKGVITEEEFSLKKKQLLGI
jgi:hypothetical protein